MKKYWEINCQIFIKTIFRTFKFIYNFILDMMRNCTVTEMCLQVWSMMHVRVNLRVALGALCLAAVALMLYWSHCPNLAPRPSMFLYTYH